MIDKAEATFLLNTDSAIAVIDHNVLNKVYSPWIYSELMCTRLVRKKPLLVYRNCSRTALEHFEKVEEKSFKSQLPIYYEMNLEHLLRLYESNLEQWKKLWDECQVNTMDYSAMDLLYKQVCPKEWKADRSYILGLSLEERLKIQKMYGAENKAKKKLFIDC